jgi:hypothetical protein
VGQQAPQVIGASDTARHSTTNTDDRDRFHGGHACRPLSQIRS